MLFALRKGWLLLGSLLHGSLSVKAIAAVLRCSGWPTAAADRDSRMLLMLYEALLMLGSESSGSSAAECIP